MYTQCPDCNTAFRVTADVLKQAVGKVRCGACGRAFNALEFLSETRPGQASATEAEVPLPELKPDEDQSDSSLRRISPEQRATLLKTLDQLAGSDIRIEDTGIEWRVLDEDEGDKSDIDELLDESPTPVDEFLTSTPTTVEAGEIFDSPTNPFSESIADELRFDDNTPLPDDFDPDEQQIDMPESPDVDQDVGDAGAASAGTAADESVDDEQDDWADILDEFDEPPEPRVLPLDAELAAIEDAERLTDTDIALQQQEQAPDAAATDAREPAEDPDEDLAGKPDDDDAAPLEFGSITAAGSDLEAPSDAPDPDLVDGEGVTPPGDATVDDDFWDGATAFPEQSQQRIAAVDASPGFESIVMEGEFVRSELDKEKLAADMAAASEIADKVRAAWDAENTEPTFGKPKGSMAAAVALSVLLLIQVAHQSRDALATVPVFDSVVSSVYRAIGMPVWPAWDVTVWRFEATRGSADENNEKLTVYSRVGNMSGRAAPYPMIGITLTDRFEEPVGSRILKPSEYLGENLDFAGPVAAGATFDAVLSIQSPPDEATGFKLKVCYPLSAGKLRCASDGFK